MKILVLILSFASLTTIGVLISQKQLSTGGYEVVIENSKTKERKTFISGSMLDDQVENFEPGYEITIEYITNINPTTHTTELVVSKTSVAGSIKSMKH